MGTEVDSDSSDHPYQELTDQRVTKSRADVTIDPASVFPDRPLMKQDVTQFGMETTIDYCVPYYTPVKGERLAGGLMYEQDETVMSAVFDPDEGWTPVGAYSRHATYETLDDDYWDPHLLFVAEDVDFISALHLETLRAMKWPTPIPEVFIHDSNQSSPTNEVDFTFCSCSNPIGVQKMPVPIETNQQYGICISCSGLWGIRMQQENIPVSTLLNPDWILADAVDGIIETAGTPDSDYALLTTAGGSFRRIERTLELLALMCSTETRATEYDPTHHTGLLYVHEGTVIGFLFWQITNQTQTLMQTYVTPSWRQHGLARSMLTMWITDCQQTEPYYVEDPIPGMRSLLEELKQWDPTDEQNSLAVRVSFCSPHLHSPPGTKAER